MALTICLGLSACGSNGAKKDNTTGVFMLFGNKLKQPSFGFNGEDLARKGGLGALLPGMLFAMAYCPTSGVFYFGMLILRYKGMSVGGAGMAIPEMTRLTSIFGKKLVAVIIALIFFTAGIAGYLFNVL